MPARTFTKIAKLQPAAAPATKLDWSVAIGVALMSAIVLAVIFGNLGPATAYAAPVYAAVPM